MLLSRTLKFLYLVRELIRKSIHRPGRRLVKFVRVRNLGIFSGIFLFGMAFTGRLDESSEFPPTVIARILQQKLLKEGHDYLKNQPLESKKIEKVVQFLNDLSAHQAGNTQEKRKQQATLNTLTFHFEQEINDLLAEKRRLLKITDALRISKIKYEVEAVISENEREIFVNYIKFNTIRINKLNQAIRQREQFLKQIKKIRSDSDRHAGRWYLLSGGVITLTLFWLFWANQPDQSF